MPSLRLRVLLAIAIAAALLCALPLLLHMRALLSPCNCTSPTNGSAQPPFRGDLRLLSSSWNHLTFPSSASNSSSSSSLLLLHIALFVKKWPSTSSVGGLERHALTLHRHLAYRGHHIHVFTTDGITAQVRDEHDGSLHLHICPPNERGLFDIAPAWDAFLTLNASRPFDIVHSESVALPPAKAKEVGGAAVVSWHGIAYEIIHSDIVRELNRLEEGQPRAKDLQRALSERISRVVEEVRLFPSYAHHVATSDYAGDVLNTIYQIPLHRLHIIVNGVDEQVFHPDTTAAQSFRAAWGVPPTAMVFGAAGRLVKDKGYPLLFHAFSLLLAEHPSVFLLIAGDGPWATRFKALSPTNVVVLGPLRPAQLAHFYNAIDIFVNPTLRAQGLDHTLLEAMLCGKPILATHFSSITTSLIVNPSMGYTFHPNVPSLLASMRSLMTDGKQALQKKGKLCHQRASSLFTATKMASAYERLFLCIKDSSYCMYS
ncbi:hypothetical protein GOP47_0016178 [Adiantum capillus-veneris]|uniref:Glycosyltransferase subfamily 4-like N-terminal domain-containing protein n=1 Tax=Adiantum capillus-veneris TaxID=13818 RepID=A0A9D4ZDA8_ADICA|nr:hypothetical protein GOP47_0016178 [Adiantum capillus-veneris]